MGQKMMTIMMMKKMDESLCCVYYSPSGSKTVFGMHKTKVKTKESESLPSTREIKFRAENGLLPGRTKGGTCTPGRGSASRNLNSPRSHTLVRFNRPDEFWNSCFVQTFWFTCRPLC